MSRMLHVRRKTLAVERFSDLLTASSFTGVGTGGSKSSSSPSPEKEVTAAAAIATHSPLPVTLQPVLQSKLARQRQTHGQATAPPGAFASGGAPVAAGSPQDIASAQAPGSRGPQTPKAIHFTPFARSSGANGAAATEIKAASAAQRPHTIIGPTPSTPGGVLKAARPDLPLHIVSSGAPANGRRGGSPKRPVLGARTGAASKSVQFSPPPEALGRHRNLAGTQQHAHSVSFSLGAGADDGSNSSLSVSEEAGVVFEPIDLHSPGADGPCETEPVEKPGDGEELVDVQVPESRAFREPSPEAAVMASAIIPPPPPVAPSPTSGSAATSPRQIRVQVSFSGIEFDECSPTHEPPAAEKIASSHVDAGHVMSAIPSGRSAFMPFSVAVVPQPVAAAATHVANAPTGAISGRPDFAARSQTIASPVGSVFAPALPPTANGARPQMGRVVSASEGQQQRRPPMVRAPQIVVDPPSDPDVTPEDV